MNIEIWRGNGTEQLMLSINDKRISGVKDGSYSLVHTFPVKDEVVLELLSPKNNQ